MLLQLRQNLLRSHHDGQRLLSTPFSLLNPERDPLPAQPVEENDMSSTFARIHGYVTGCKAGACKAKSPLLYITVCYMATRREIAGIPQDAGSAIGATTLSCTSFSTDKAANSTYHWLRYPCPSFSLYS